MRSPRATRPLVAAVLCGLVCAALAAPAPARSDGEGDRGPPPSAYAPPAQVEAPSRPLLVRPHLSVGVLSGDHSLGFAGEAGLRIHPVLLLYAAEVIGTDDGGEYATFSGARVGYQHTLSEWFAAYGAFGAGVARYELDLGGSLRGTAFTLDAGVAVVKHRGMNVFSVGMHLVAPSVRGLPPGSRLDRPSVHFSAAMNPLLLLLAR